MPPNPAPKLDEQNAAAAEIAELCSRILALAPAAGLYVGIKIQPASEKGDDNAKC